MKKVLIVEDDPMLSEVYQKKFEKNGKFKVINASSGLEAQEKAKKEIPDLILLDLVLPEVDGFDVLAALRKEPTLDDTKIVPFSNLSQEDNKKKLEELGADGFISKAEYTPSQLVAEIEKILEGNEKEEVSVKVNLKRSIDADMSAENAKKILIIEDEEVFLEIFSGKLEDAGYVVEKASSGKKGQNLLSQGNFNLAIVDIVLSDTNAEQIITDFKLGHSQIKTKFIILKNESDSKKDFDALKKLGIQAAINKNEIDPEQFVKEIEKFLK